MSTAEDKSPFVCGDCGETVPFANRIIHSLQCGRHRERRNASGSVAAVAPSASAAAAVCAVPEHTGLASERGAGASTLTQLAGATAAGTPTEPASLSAACEFCDLYIALRELVEHVRLCSARTDVCEVCLCYVRLRDMAAHRNSGCAFGATAAVRASADNENDQLLPQADNTHYLEYDYVHGGPRRRTVTQADLDEVPRWAPVAVAAVGAIAAAAVFSSFRRRR